MVSHLQVKLMLFCLRVFHFSLSYSITYSYKHHKFGKQVWLKDPGSVPTSPDVVVLMYYLLFHLSLVCSFVISLRDVRFPISETSLCPLFALFYLCSSTLPPLHLYQCTSQFTSEFLNQSFILNSFPAAECNCDYNCLSVGDDYCQLFVSC